MLLPEKIFWYIEQKQLDNSIPPNFLWNKLLILSLNMIVCITC